MSKQKNIIEAALFLYNVNEKNGYVPDYELHNPEFCLPVETMGEIRNTVQVHTTRTKTVEKKLKSVFDSPEMEACQKATDDFEKWKMDRIKSNPDNGKYGWWKVEGIRHNAYTKASSASEAIQKAEEAGIVGSWEFPEARFWTEELPEVF